MQVTHAPPLQTWFVPQEEPFGALPDSMQTGAPVLHVVVPVRQALPVTAQLDPATQVTQVPVALHTLSCPHAPPAGTFIPVSVQVGVVPVQVSVPVWQALPGGVHASPFTHALHIPSWQTMPVPHEVPFALLSVSVQTGAPVEQTMVPARHGLFATSHVAPAVHAWQTPSRQTPLSHVVPLACDRCVSRHVIAPPAHSASPW
jgi:hypothetical protein